jgi:hypothetical protein
MQENELEKLSNKELLIKTFGEVERLKGVVSNGLTDRIVKIERYIEKRPERTVSIISLIIAAMAVGVAVYSTMV